MQIAKSLYCPKCSGKYFKLKRQASYVYTYNIITPETKEWSTEKEQLSFLFDNRELLSKEEYLECSTCGAEFPYDLGENRTNIDFTIVQQAIRSDYQEHPEFIR